MTIVILYKFKIDTIVNPLILKRNAIYVNKNAIQIFVNIIDRIEYRWIKILV
jgi:hypothetical protein